ncbi:MAG TPA: methionine synthase, partial [Armatimonadetes bacterium]|nr:methionine synthase [Armatimonadota bacterium]
PREIFPLARRYNAAVVALTIDEEGMARSAERKVEIARRIYDLALDEYGLQPEDLLFDPLTLPISTGLEDDRANAAQTIEGLRRIKEACPGSYTLLGLSNVSFGLKPAARAALNSVFLHECRAAGLDSAIVHAGRIQPLYRIDEAVRETCLDLIYDRRREGYDPLTALVSLFETVSTEAAAERPVLSLEEDLPRRIIEGDRQGLEAQLDLALESYGALDIINDYLLEGMKTVGELFGSGQMQLPFVLQSAEVMKTAVAYLEPHMPKAEGGRSRGTMVLATVKGDVHDIGKNL